MRDGSPRSSRGLAALHREVSAARAELAAASSAHGPLDLLAGLTSAVERLSATQHELVNVLLDDGFSWDEIGTALDTSTGAAERRFPRRRRRAPESSAAGG